MAKIHPMKNIAHVLVLVLCSLVHQAALAQDDAPWWKRLFRKETVEEMEQEGDSPAVPEAAEVPADSVMIDGGAEELSRTDSVDAPVLRRVLPGEITMALPEGIGRLDSLYMEHPPALMGYRVQVYFGRLQDARDQRAEYIRSDLDYPSYLIQNPPNFAVQLGDFRTRLEAWRAMQDLKELYPASIVVPAEIEWPSLESQGSDSTLNRR